MGRPKKAPPEVELPNRLAEAQAAMEAPPPPGVLIDNRAVRHQAVDELGKKYLECKDESAAWKDRVKEAQEKLIRKMNDHGLAWYEFTTPNGDPYILEIDKQDKLKCRAKKDPDAGNGINPDGNEVDDFDEE